jgi:pimeloyl-ACP methyl ester carboxylesterase
LNDIDTGMFVEINGALQWITIRGSDLKNPVMLMLPGPGAGFSRMAEFFSPWERDFTLVQWDQPGAGATAAKHGAEAVPMNYDRIVRDGIAVAEWVLHRLAVPTIALLAFSGGTIIGLKMIRERPEFFSAYVGSGQIVNWARQDTLSYRLILEGARAARNAAAIAELESIGAPPYSSAAEDAVKSKYAGAPTPAEQRALAQLDPRVLASMNAPPPDANYVPRGLTLGDTRTQAMAAYTALRDELVAFDARRLGLKYVVPMLFLQGELDEFTVTSEVRVFADEIEAPRKVFALLEGAGHSAFLMRDEFLASLNRHLRPIG